MIQWQYEANRGGENVLSLVGVKEGQIPLKHINPVVRDNINRKIKGSAQESDITTDDTDAIDNRSCASKSFKDDVLQVLSPEQIATIAPIVMENLDHLDNVPATKEAEFECNIIENIRDIVGETSVSRCVSSSDSDLGYITMLELEHRLSTALNIQKYVVQTELKAGIDSMKEIMKKSNIQYISNMRKHEQVNIMSKLFGDSSVIHPNKTKKKNSPKRLRNLCADILMKSYPKEALNIIYAENIYPQELSIWESSALFTEAIRIKTIDESPRWYSQPEFYPDEDFVVFRSGFRTFAT